MKRILYSICIGALALSVATAFGEEDHRSNGKPAGAVSRSHASVRGGTMRSSTHVVHGGTMAARTYHAAPQTVSRSTYRNNVSSRRNVVVNRASSNVAVNRTRNVATRNNVVVNRDRNARVNNNWQGNRFSGRSYAAFRDYHRQWHDRGWWRSHYNRIIFVSGGWYYWNAGYWFPAWGYDPYYSYPYDGPIYGYNGLAPNQVIVDVQSQLQQDGYYNGPIDGVLGPMTRQAIAGFQVDHGLAVTSAIDEPTLDSLGIS